MHNNKVKMDYLVRVEEMFTSFTEKDLILKTGSWSRPVVLVETVKMEVMVEMDALVPTQYPNQIKFISIPFSRTSTSFGPPRKQKKHESIN